MKPSILEHLKYTTICKYNMTNESDSEKSEHILWI